MRILLVEPYHTGSHRAWAEGYARHSPHDVALVSHPGRFWKWRMAGGFVTLAEAARRIAAERGPPDVVLASSMLHLPAFLGAARDVLSGVPAALYVHENQLTYPSAPDDRPDLSYPVINWASMQAADLVVFNSEFHRREWFTAIPKLLRHFPDQRHTHLVEGVTDRSVVIPVGVDLQRLAGPGHRAHPPLILWNQRWEYDKEPARFFAALRRLDEAGIAFRVALAGENNRTHPGEFHEAAQWLGERLVHFGRAGERDYRRLLRSADVVVSTARHEFFGVAVVEAMYAGAFPVLPDDLAYPEHLPGDLHDSCLYRDDVGLDRLLHRALSDSGLRASVRTRLRESLQRYDWPVVAPAYDAALAGLVTGRAQS